MSGHSKWASIRHKKGAADAKRGKIFSKLAKLISVAAKTGGSDLEMNFSLRMIVDKAKKANMPKDNIERAISRGSGEGADSIQMTEAVYEAMGPGGSALLIETLTDNTNRTLGNVKTIITKRGGNFGAKVLWLFEKKGVVRVESRKSKVESQEDRDEIELGMIDAGAEDISFEEGLEIICGVTDLKKIKEAAEALNLTVDSAELAYIAKDELKLSPEDEEKLAELIELIDDDDDVTNVYTNAA